MVSLCCMDLSMGFDRIYNQQSDIWVCLKMGYPFMFFRFNGEIADQQSSLWYPSFEQWQTYVYIYIYIILLGKPGNYELTKILVAKESDVGFIKWIISNSAIDIQLIFHIGMRFNFFYDSILWAICQLISKYPMNIPWISHKYDRSPINIQFFCPLDSTLGPWGGAKGAVVLDLEEFACK